MPAMSSSGTWCAVVCLALATATTTTHAARMQDNFFGVDTVDGDHAWVVGNFGAVWATSDGGATWVAQKAGTLVPLFDVDFADTTHGWIVGKGGLILHTTDGGRRWTPQPSPVAGGKHFFCVKAIDADTAWAVGDWGAVASTTDGGATWRDRSLGLLTVVPGPNVSAHDTTMTDVILYDVEFIDARHGAIAGEFGTVMLTDDGGETWRRTATGTDKTLFGVTLTSPTEAWAVGIDGIILHTIDAGTSWQVQHGVVERSDIGELSFTETVENPGLYEIAIRGSFGIVVGDTGALFMSVDGGQSWKRQELPGRNKLVWMRDVTLGAGRGFLVGAGGYTATVVDHEVVVSKRVVRAPKGN
jgi:photosystem II stability/assembly factor-like uncharacterized protein